MSDGSRQGIDAERALDTILGGKSALKGDEEKTPAYWKERLAKKNDDIDGYDAHAEVMAKYILEAYIEYPALSGLPISNVFLKGDIDWGRAQDFVLVPSVDGALKKIYPDDNHPFQRALDEATGFSWGWACNIARYALGLPEKPNPALMTIETKEKP